MIIGLDEGIVTVNFKLDQYSALRYKCRVVVMLGTDAW